MDNQIGISIAALPYSFKSFEGVLLFHEYPTTVVFQDIEGDPIIREWVDYSEQTKTDRFFYYRTDLTLLKKYISGNLPHKDLINQSKDGFVIFEDVKENQKYYSIASVKAIPIDYLPNADYYFDIDEGVHLQKIITHFNLDSILLSDIELFEAKEISIAQSSETLYVHFKKGKGIGFGTANTEVLARTLLKFDKFYKETALDFKLGTQRGDIQLSAKKNEEYLSCTTTEVYGNIAASYAVLIRPVHATQFNMFEKSDSEIISSHIFSLINNSTDVEDLKKEYNRHSDFVIKSYKAFVEEIYTSELKISLSWFSPESESEFNDEIDYIKANRIKTNLENLSIEEEEQFSIKGKFRSLNCDTAHFSFIGTSGEKFTGFIDDLIKEGSERINFISIYEITILRKITKEAGKQESKIKDILLAFIIEQ
ncbi:hypothetical protein [Pedobacter cryoconitis]|uniref:hypothetical protein n=1 Tax=Pedobacter cryoconitis TaxID=188932 RepID=UPI00161A37F4|nr:hypothetical protein [Pedobacter cryoconitis]MBB5645157.1 hypothetical protein [Pedobacter cryoconitis]